MRQTWIALIGVIAVVLAGLQAIVLATLPMANQWRPEIETLLSERFQAEVSISEIGARASWAGPYLEALNLVVARPEGRLEVRRVQLLVDLPHSLLSGELVVDQLVLDEGELVSHQSGSGGLPDPTLWADVLNTIQGHLSSLGAIKLYNFDVLTGPYSAKRLSLEVTPGLGVMARARLVTEDYSVPVAIDWRYPSAAGGVHDLRMHGELARLLIPVAGFEDVSPDLDLTLWLAIQRDQPSAGQFQLRAVAEQSLPVSLEALGRLQINSADDVTVELTTGKLALPGVEASLAGAQASWRERQMVARIPSLSLDGPAMQEAMQHSPPDSKVTRLLTGNQPRIDLSTVDLRWSPSTPVSVQAQVNQFRIEAFGGIPQIGPLTGALFTEGSRGFFEFFADAGDFALPDIFPLPWTAQRLAGVLAFAQSDDGLYIRGHDLVVADANQTVRGSLMLDLPRDTEQSVHLEILADASRDALPGLLPIDLDPEISAFLLRGIEQVEVVDARISYSGPLGRQVDRSRRELSMRFPMARYRLKPLRQWPDFEGQDGEVTFTDKRAVVSLPAAAFGGLHAHTVTVRQTRDDPTLLSIQGELTGPAETALTVLDQAGIKPEALGRDVIFSGDLRGRVDLLAPVDGAPPTGKVEIGADDLTLAVTGLSEPVTQLTGLATYNLESGFQADGLRGLLLGDAVTADVVADADGVTVNARGQLKTQHMSQLAGLPFSEALLSGTADWTARVQQQQGRVNVMLQTDGMGLASQLPFPLTKTTESPGSMLIELNMGPDEQLMTATLFGQTTVSARLDQSPLALSVRTPEIDLLGWAQLPGSDARKDQLSLLLDLDAVRVGETRLQVDQAAVNLRPDSVEVFFAGEELAGRIQRLGEAPVAINLERLILPPAGEFLAPPEEDPLADFDPGTLPSATIQVNELRRGEKRYLDLDLVAVSGDSRLDVTRLGFTRDGQRFVGEMAWTGSPSGARTALILNAEGSALGGFLRVSESEPILEAGSGTFQANLNWTGSPLAFSMLTTEGNFALRLADGRFFDLGNSAEVLRLFGILNIDTLTRRLRLDFLDLVQPGVAFDEVSASGTLGSGILTLDPELAMQGPSASFRLTGIADLNQQTLDQRLEVDIPLTNNLPLASVLLGAPQVGGAIYLVEKALGTKIIKVGKTDYRIEGSFGDPNVKLIPPFSKQKESRNANAPTNDQ